MKFKITPEMIWVNKDWIAVMLIPLLFFVLISAYKDTAKTREGIGTIVSIRKDYEGVKIAKIHFREKKDPPNRIRFSKEMKLPSEISRARTGDQFAILYKGGNEKPIITKVIPGYIRNK